MKLNWTELTEEDKLIYKSYCDSKYGEHFTRLPSGEPVYLGTDNIIYRYENVVKDMIKDNRSKRLEDILKLL